jgi:capsular polysaccharide biosynthesis protein
LKITELARLDGGAFDTTAPVYDHGAVPALGLPEVITYPDHSVWRYDGVVCLPRGTIAYHRRTLLPDSFPWHLAPQLDIRFVPRFGEHFFRVKELRSATRLDGSYFNFLSSHPGHFGHLMTEALARLWGWSPAKESDPSLKILCRRPPSTAAPGLEATLLPAFGIAPEDITWIDGGVTVEHLVGCTPMWHNAPPFYAHPAISDTWARLRTGLIGDDPVGTAPRIFVTRHRGSRPCRNVTKVERFFADHGFLIIARRR